MTGAPDPGLCKSCRHARLQRNARSSTFWRCGLADRDLRFRRYPALPVRACAGYEPGKPVVRPDAVRSDDLGG